MKTSSYKVSSAEVFQEVTRSPNSIIKHFEHSSNLTALIDRNSDQMGEDPCRVPTRTRTVGI